MRLLPFALLFTLAASTGCISTPPPHPRALQLNELCAKSLAINDLGQAEIHCDHGLEFSPQYGDLWVNKGIIAYRAGRKDDAKEHFIKALRFNQEQAQAYNNLGNIYLEEGSYGKAHDNFQRALKVNPDYTEARYNLALTFMKRGETEKAQKELRTILTVNPSLADPHHSLGVMAYQGKKYEEAVREFSQAVQLSPDYPAAWLDLGVALMELGRYNDAAEAFGSCLHYEPNNSQCLDNFAKARGKQALVDPGLKELEKTTAAENTPPAYLELAKNLQSRGLLSEEEKAYKKCLQLDPKFAPCHFGLHELFAKNNRRKEAEIACKNFLKYGAAEDSPKEVETCEKFLGANNL